MKKNKLPYRIRREKLTITKMIELYCKDLHNNNGQLCNDCVSIQEYAYQRLLYCPFHKDKPVCSNCIVHCYKPEMREKVKAIMRYSGPRMLLKHPYLALLHIIDEKIFDTFRRRGARKF
ncbi:MAG: nitrous oxide-stimulated promoter family protein [Candidatus Hadarchaeum sp.]|uniref:nitrous oxide-stimulated promoter family protein n=1 Tax=Candidatus Hadarchaeum sp. TaxID=2883567 RepID=UPI003D0B05AE